MCLSCISSNVSLCASAFPVDILLNRCLSFEPPSFPAGDWETGLRERREGGTYVVRASSRDMRNEIASPWSDPGAQINQQLIVLPNSYF